MSDVSRGEILDIIAEFAAKNPDYRKSLLENPKQVLSKQMNQSLWKFAEVGLEEKQSSTLLVERLKRAGFEVKSGVGHLSRARRLHYRRMHMPLMHVTGRSC